MNHIEWLKARQKGIGGSDAGAILGIHPFKTVLDVYESKVSTIRGDEKPNFAMLMGNVLEPIAADLYSEETGRQVRRQPQRAHPDYPFILGNVDRQILATGDVDSTGVLEIKCPQIRTIANVKAHGLPDYMTVQLMHYLAVYGYSWGSFALFNQNAGLIHFDLERDDEFINTLLEYEIDFWQNHVVPKRPPPIFEEEIEIPQVEGELTVVNTPEWLELATDLQEAQSLRKAATDLEDATKEKIKEFMHREELHAVEVDGFARFYYKMMSGSTSWKKTAEAIAKEANLDPNEFIVKGKSYPRFTTYFIGGNDGN